MSSSKIVRLLLAGVLSGTLAAACAGEGAPEGAVGSPEVSSENLGLRPPSGNRRGGDNPAASRPLTESVVFQPCAVVDERTGGMLLHSDQEVGVPNCYLLGPAGLTLPREGETDIWSAGVIYIPEHLTTEDSLTSVVDAGGIHLQWRFNFPESGAPPEDDPGDPDGGHRRFEREPGVIGVVQRLATMTRIGWPEEGPDGRVVAVAIESGRSPRFLVAFAQTLVDGPPSTPN